MRMTMEDMDGVRTPFVGADMGLPPITMEDMLAAVSIARPSASAEAVERLRAWTEKYGQEGR